MCLGPYLAISKRSLPQHPPSFTWFPHLHQQQHERPL